MKFIPSRQSPIRSQILGMRKIPFCWLCLFDGTPGQNQLDILLIFSSSEVRFRLPVETPEWLPNRSPPQPFAGSGKLRLNESWIKQVCPLYFCVFFAKMFDGEFHILCHVWYGIAKESGSCFFWVVSSCCQLLSTELVPFNTCQWSHCQWSTRMILFLMQKLILLMEELLHHLGGLKPYTEGTGWPDFWTINSMNPLPEVCYVVFSMTSTFLPFQNPRQTIDFFRSSRPGPRRVPGNGRVTGMVQPFIGKMVVPFKWVPWVTLIINPIYTSYSGYWLGIYPLFKGLFGMGQTARRYHPKGPSPFSLWIKLCHAIFKHAKLQIRSSGYALLKDYLFPQGGPKVTSYIR